MMGIIKRKYFQSKQYLRLDRVNTKPRRPRASKLPATPDSTLIFDSLIRQDDSSDDNELMCAILQRNIYLTPTSQEQAAISGLMAKVQTIFDSLVIAPNDLEACKVEAAHPIGAFKTGTMVRGRNVADILIILANAPTKETILALTKFMKNQMRILSQTEILMRPQFITIEANHNGIDVFNFCARVRVLLATSSMQGLNANVTEMQQHLTELKYTRWFEQNANHSSMKALIRIVREMAERYGGLRMLNQRTIDVLVHYASLHHITGEMLPIHKAFCRIFQLLAAGIFLPGSKCIRDTCDESNKRLDNSLTLEEKDVCCMTAQTLLRTLLNGGYTCVLGMEDGAVQGGHCNGVVVLPAEKVYAVPVKVKIEPMDQN